MNQRIVKLITEADAYAWTIAEKYVPECGEVNYLWEDAFREKFAELIVKQCVHCVLNGKFDEEEFNPNEEFHRGHNIALDNTAEGLSQYFGVEE